MHNDDTGMPILRLTREPGDKRTGTFTSHRIDGWCMDHRAVLYRMEARGREHCRCAETAGTRTAGADPDVRRAVAQQAETGRRRTSDGQLPRPWKAAGGGGGR